jgi:Mrp family chromosome partitioning ATPase
MGAGTLVCLAELLSGEAGRGEARVPHTMPAAIASTAPASWIGAVSDRKKRDASTNSRAPELGALADHVRKLGRGVFAVTSVDGADAARAVAVDLARELAKQGARVSYLDFDVAAARNAAAADPATPGLADLLFGVASFGEVIQRDPASRVHIIPVGRGIRDTATLLAAERLAIALGALSQTYDHVVLFVPALATVAGGARLARFSRGAVLVAPEGSESSGAAASDALGARGFANVAVATVGADAPGQTTSRAAA